MTAGDFAPERLTTDASLNHVILSSLGVPEGRLAEDVCSRDALLSLAGDLGLAGLRSEQLADDLGRALADDDMRAARVTATALRMYGLRLGILITTLCDPQTAAWQADTPARRAFLAHWPTISSIWLAGGLLAHACGGLILEGARAVAARAPHPVDVALTPCSAFAALVGAALRTHAECPDGTLAVADLGHTYIKTAATRRSGNRLSRFRLLDRYPAPASRSATDVEDVVAAALGRVVRKAAGSSARRICLVVSIASFVANGEPIDDGQGIYGRLSGRTAALLRRIKVDTGVSADVEFVHDGTAAASAVTSANSATITVGTWLGVGFQPIGGLRLLELHCRTQPSGPCHHRNSSRQVSGEQQ
jgi:hypothetical protein